MCFLCSRPVGSAQLLLTELLQGLACAVHPGQAQQVAALDDGGARSSAGMSTALVSVPLDTWALWCVAAAKARGAAQPLPNKDLTQYYQWQIERGAVCQSGNNGMMAPASRQHTELKPMLPPSHASLCQPECAGALVSIRQQAPTLSAQQPVACPPGPLPQYWCRRHVRAHAACGWPGQGRSLLLKHPEAYGVRSMDPSVANSQLHAAMTAATG